MPINAVSPVSILTPLSRSNQRLSELLQQLATNDRLVRPSIDPAGLVASAKMLSQLGGLEAAGNSVTYGRNIAALADASLSGIGEQLSDVKRLAIQAANSGFADEATQAALQGAIDQQVSSINNQLSQVNFAGTPLFANAAFQTTDDTAGVLTQVQFAQTPTPVGNGIDVNVTVNSTGQQAQSTLTVSGQTTFTLGGAQGSTTITGSTSDQIAAQINATTSDTGVSATVNGGQVDLVSENAGSSQFISVQNVSGTGFGAGETGIFNGTDASVSVNGVTFQGEGNLVSFNANGIQGSFVVDSTAAAGTQTQVSIVGGGITIPTDGNGGSVTFGIPAFGSSLGQSSGIGNIGSLTTGGSASLNSGNLTDQLDIIDAAIGEVTASRAQIGGVDSYLGSAGRSIESQISSLSAAHNDIRGLDVAASVIELTRTKLQREVQLALLGRANASQAGALRLLGIGGK